MTVRTDSAADLGGIKDAHAAKAPLPTLTLAEIRARTAGDREVLVVFRGGVYDLTKWARYHPGGDLAILHMNGRDATDAIQAYHPAWAIDQKMPRFLIARLASPSTLSAAERAHAEHNERVSRLYRAADEEIKAAGLYVTDYGFYWREGFKFFCFWAGACGLVLAFPHSWVALLASAFLFGALWQQAAFVAHDAGHSGISHDGKTDTVFGICLGNFLGGVSLGWWKKNHNVHHIITNSVEHDPDIQHLPFLAVSVRFLENVYSTYYKRTLDFDAFAKAFVPLQHHLFYVILLFGRFNLYANSWAYATSRDRVPHRRLEIAGLIFFWVWYGALLMTLPTWSRVFTLLMLSHMLTAILHVQITLSHFGMDTSEKEDETFAEMALRTTMDVDCPQWLDWFHGGLQFQVEHHLFPRVPRHNLRAVRPRVVRLAEQLNVEFKTFRFLEGNGFVIRHLKSVADGVSSAIKVAAPLKKAE